MAETRHRLRGAAVRAAAIVLLPLTAAGATEAPFEDAELRVRIGGVWTMRLAARGGAWEPVVRARPSFKHVDFGYVTASEGTPARFRVEMQLRLDGGARSPGHVFYEMTFTRTSPHTYEGTFAETHGTETQTGTVAAALRPPLTDAPPDRGPVEPGEHPRLLLRRADLAALRAKLETPFGRAFLAKAEGSRDPVVLGVLYRATGEEARALEALRIVQGYDDIDGNAGLTGNIGHQLVRVVLTLDLCYDAWPEAYRASLLRRIRARLPKRQYDLIIGHANYNQVSNYYGPGFGSAAIASLVLKGTKGPAPEPPEAPLAVTRPDGRVAPLTDYDPPQGVPVVPLVDDELPKEWIYAGGLKPAEGVDLLAPLGGPRKARPTLTDELTDGTATARFRPVSHEKDKGYFHWMNRDVLDVTMAIGRICHSQSVFYTVLRNEEPGWYEFGIGRDHKESWTYLNGIRIEEGHLVRLEKGLYALLVKVRIGQTEPWGREMLAVRFTRFKEDARKGRTVEATNDAIRARHRQARAYAEAARAEWAARGGEDPACLRMFHKGREQMYQHLRFGVGDGGFQAEATHYGNIAARYPLLYAACYRSALGRDLSTNPDATHVLPRRMMQAALRPGRVEIMHLGVKGRFEAEGCAELFPLVPERWKPSLLWGWNRILGAEVERAADLDHAAADALLAGLSGRTLAATFVNYPDGMDPVHPSKGMPRTWAAPTLGYYLFRSGWAGGEAFIAQVFAKSIPIRAWSHPNAGAFRLWGLGRRWTAAPIERSGYRPEECVVLLPDDVTNEGACGRVVHHEAEPDGSGMLAIDLGDVYLAVPPPPKPSKDEQMVADIEAALEGPGEAPEDDLGITEAIEDMPVPKDVTDYFREQDRRRLRRRLPKLYDAWGDRREDVDVTSPVDGARAFAFDYSGACGAPCLAVIVDEVRGGRTKQWLWHLPPGDEVIAETDGNTFTIRYPDATLRGTFVSPAPIKLQYHHDAKMHFIYRGGSKKGALITRHYNFVAAETDAPDAVFFVVVTVQRGTPPVVTSTGVGTETVTTVGGRTVRYRDGRILIE